MQEQFLASFNQISIKSSRPLFFIGFRASSERTSYYRSNVSSVNAFHSIHPSQSLLGTCLVNSHCKHAYQRKTVTHLNNKVCLTDYLGFLNLRLKTGYEQTPSFGKRLLRGMCRAKNSLKQGSLAVVPKAPRSRECFASHKQTINGVRHRRLNRLPRYTTRTTTCFQTERSHLSGLLRLLDCL